MQFKNVIALCFVVLLSACASTSYNGGAPSEISSDDDFIKQVSVVSWVTAPEIQANNHEDIMHPKQALKESFNQASNECRQKGLEDPAFLRSSCYLEASGKYYCNEVFQCDSSNSDAQNNRLAVFNNIKSFIN